MLNFPNTIICLPSAQISYVIAIKLYNTAFGDYT